MDPGVSSWVLRGLKIFRWNWNLHFLTLFFELIFYKNTVISTKVGNPKFSDVSIRIWYSDQKLYYLENERRPDFERFLHM